MRRNNLDICADLLQIARSGARKTHLVYQANLNFSIAGRYLERLVGDGLITIEKGHYFTTEKGVEFLNRYDELTNV